MSDFVTIPITTDPDTLADAAVAYLQAQVPEWTPSSGHLESWLIDALARMTAEASLTAASVPQAIFSAFGQQLVGIAPVSGAAATVGSTWTAINTAGYTIPAGTLCTISITGDTTIGWTVLDAVTIPPGSSATTAGAVTLIADDLGTAANGITTGTSVQVIDALSWVSSVVTYGASAGGVDAETDAEYIARLAAELQLMTPRPILPDDFAVLARRVAGVTRALAIDGLDPAVPSTGNERMVCVAPIDATGAAVSSTIRTNVQTYLDGLREVSFVVNTTTPTSTTIDVTATVVTASGYDSTALETSVSDAVTSWLSPAMWAGGNENPPVWRTGQDTVRYLDAARVIGTVPGVDYVSALTVNAGTADVTLTGYAPLPAVGTITITAV